MRTSCWMLVGVGLCALGCKSTGTDTGGTTGSGSTGGTSTSGSGSGTGGGTGGTSGSACPGFLTLCDGGCVSTLTDPGACGSCGKSCAATQVCVGGQCVAPSSCPEGTMACGQQCSDPLTDPLNCGKCNQPCGLDEGCANGVCVAELIPIDAGGPSCPPGGPRLPAIDAGGPLCAGALAQVNFRFGLCSCGDAAVDGQLMTDAFDSQTGPYLDGGQGGALGFNGNFTANSNLALSGLCAIGGDGGFTINADSALAHDLDVNGPLLVQASTSVGGSVRVNGDVTADSPLVIAKALYLPDASSVNLINVTAAQVVRGPVSVPPPCDCAPEQLVDIAGYVAAAKTANDDAAVGLTPGLLVNLNGPGRLELPCGRYYLDAIQSNADLTIAIHGPVLLFVGGDVQPNAALQFAVDPSATLDLFIGGNLVTNQAASFGSTLVPAQSRVYVAGSQVIFNQSALLAGNFYLPASGLTPDNSLHVYGSLFVGSYTQNNDTALHYDSAILAAAGSCGDAGTAATSCHSCRDCLNQACRSGTCGACQTSADCCAPLSCAQGLCLSIN